METATILELVIFSFSLIPTIVLFNQYFKTKISDLIIFAGFFFIGGLVQVANIVNRSANILIFMKMQFFLYNLTFFLLFLHIIRMKWDLKHDSSTKIFKIIAIIGITWFLVLEIMILFWQTLPQPEFTTIFSIKIPRVDRSIPHPYGAGLIINHRIVYSTDFDFLGDLFSLYVSIIAMHTYASIRGTNTVKEIQYAKKLWIIAYCFLSMFSLLTLPYLQFSINIARSILIVGILIVLYFSILKPEALLISKTQLLRAVHLYKMAEMERKKSLDNDGEFENQLFDYILLVQKELNLFDEHKV